MRIVKKGSHWTDHGVASRAVAHWMILGPIILALGWLELMIGGAKVLYAAPAAALLGMSGIFWLSPAWQTTGRLHRSALLATLVFGAYMLARNRLSEVEHIGRLHFFILAGSLLVYLAVALALTRPVDRKRLFGFIIVLALLQLAPATVQFFWKQSWMPLPWAQRQQINWRASGFFISPNNFAGLAEIAALLACSMALLGRASLQRRILLICASLACVAGVLMSGSRGGYLGLGAGAFALLVLAISARSRTWHRHSAKPLLPAVLVAIFLVAGVLVWWAVYADPVLNDRVEAIDDIDYVRLHLWSAALQQLKLSPLWGTGAFSFLHYGRMFRDPSVLGDPIHVHNDYLQLLADYGCAAMVLFLAMLLVHGLSGFRTFRQLALEAHSVGGHSDRLALVAGCLAILAAYLAHSVVEFNMQLPLNALVIAAVFGVLANPGAPESDEDESVPRQPGWAPRTVMALGGLFVIAAAWRMAPGEYFTERARFALRAGHPAEALEWTRTGLLRTKDNPELFYQAGEAALQASFASPDERRELRKKAVESFTASLRIFPYDSRTVLKLAQAQAASGDYFGAVDSLVYAEQIDPNSGYVPAFRGIVEYWNGYLDDAEAAFQQALSFGGGGSVIARDGLLLVEKARAAENEKVDRGDSFAPQLVPDSEAGEASLQEAK